MYEQDTLGPDKASCNMFSCKILCKQLEIHQKQYSKPQIKLNI